MEKQFLTKEKMERLMYLGISDTTASVLVGILTECQGDAFYFNGQFDLSVIKDVDEFDCEQNDLSQFKTKYKAFTLQDILNLLPDHLHVKGTIYTLSISKNFIAYESETKTLNAIIGCDFLDNAYKMLCWVLERNKNF